MKKKKQPTARVLPHKVVVKLSDIQYNSICQITHHVSAFIRSLIDKEFQLTTQEGQYEFNFKAVQRKNF